MSYVDKFEKSNPDTGDINDGTRACKRCLIRQPMTQFHWAGRGNKYRRRLCKSCDYSDGVRNRQLKPDQYERSNRERYLSKKYNISLGVYAEMLTHQENLCASCRGQITTRYAYVDHDHSCCPGETSCGKCVRGLLCLHCNTGLGYFYDSPAKLRAAADYLESRITSTGRWR